MNMFYKTKIVKCSSPEYWYKDKVGLEVFVRSMDWSSVFVEDKITGYSINRWDLQQILICNNCKRYYKFPQEKCICGSTFLSITHQSNITKIEK